MTTVANGTKALSRYVTRETSVVVSSSLCVPAVPLFRVRAYDCEADETVGFEVMPVLALQSAITDRYAKQFVREGASKYPGMQLSREDLESQDWQRREREESVHVVFIDPEYGLISSRDMLFDDDRCEVCIESEIEKAKVRLTERFQSDRAREKGSAEK
jgi:hypothetical protein